MDKLNYGFLYRFVYWVVLTLVVRDGYVLHLWQLLHKMVEISVSGAIPAFKACWWEHLFVDIILRNTPAIALGLFLC